MHNKMILVFILTLFSSLFAQEEKKSTYDVFFFEKEVLLPGTPEVLFDAVT